MIEKMIEKVIKENNTLKINVLSQLIYDKLTLEEISYIRDNWGELKTKEDRPCKDEVISCIKAYVLSNYIGLYKVTELGMNIVANVGGLTSEDYIKKNNATEFYKKVAIDRGAVEDIAWYKVCKDVLSSEQLTKLVIEDEHETYKW